jgi:HK97 family phage portal protein
MVVDKIASIIASLPYKLVNRRGEIVEAPSDLTSLLKGPNNIDNFYEFIYRIVSSYEVTGNAYIYSTTPVGFVRPGYLQCAIAQDVTINTKNGLAWGDVLNYSINYLGLTIPPERMLHIKRPNILSNSNYGLSSLYSGQPIYTASNNTFEAGASIHKNRGASGVISPKDSNMPLTPDERQDMQRQLNEATAGASKTGMNYVSSVGVNFTGIGMNATDLRLIEFSIEHLRDTCSLFGVSSALFNDPANKTYNNMREAKAELYKDVLIPLASNIMGQLSEWLIQNAFGLDGTLVVDTDKVEALQEDADAKHQRVNASVSAGIITAEEARKILYPELPAIEKGSASSSTDALNEPKAETANELAQANLRGSVGGVQGILQIQQSFVAGVTSESSAISILIEIYGFNEETARQILGV